MDAKFYGLIREQFIQIRFEFADLNGLRTSLNKEKKFAAKDWITDFCKRHELALPASEQCSMGRNTERTEIQCQIFFKNLGVCCQEKKIGDFKNLKIQQHRTGIVTPFPSACMGQFHHHDETLLAALFILDTSSERQTCIVSVV